MGYMILEVELKNGGLVELTGPNAKYWAGCGLPDYEGDIAGLPEPVLNELIARNAVRTTK